MRFPILAIAAALAVAGCDATTFASVNATLIATKQAATQANNVPLPAAAIAAGLGALELVKALSASSKASSGPALFKLAALTTGDQDVVNSEAKVNMHLRYTSSTSADGTVTAAITSFTGTAQGYAIDAAGSFSYDPAGQVACAMTGSMGYDGTTFTVKELKVATSFPLPTSDAALGSCVFQHLDGTTVKEELTAKLAVNASGGIVASGDLTKDGVTTPLTNFGQL